MKFGFRDCPGKNYDLWIQLQHGVCDKITIDQTDADNVGTFHFFKPFSWCIIQDCIEWDANYWGNTFDKANDADSEELASDTYPAINGVLYTAAVLAAINAAGLTRNCYRHCAHNDVV